MSFVVSARKYRPIQFDQVVGQGHVTDTLKTAISQDKLAHAFLFTGPRGVGKTTCARILAKTINCENVIDGKPCNQCSSCTSFNENSSFNIIELDAASNNSVEHIRTLTDQVRFQPQHGKYKVFIIDEVHMLSQSAFNAFLKTLEEPPPYAIFILATTEKHKIIPTILSRCQIFDFKRIQIPAIIHHLQAIADKESIDIDQEALYFIAEKADGALRDSLSIFDRIVSSTDGKVLYKDVIEKLNILDHDYFFETCESLVSQDISQCLTVFNQILKNGFEGDHFINGLAEHFRNLLLCKDKHTISLLETSEALKIRYINQSRLFSTSIIMTSLDLCNQCDLNYQRARNKRLHVEITLLKMATFKDLITADPGQSISKEKKTLIPKELRSTKEHEVTPFEKEDNQITSAGKRKKGNRTIPKSPELQNTPSIQSIDHLINEVKVDHEKIQQKEINLDIELLKKTWNEYSNRISSPSIASVLNRAQLSFDSDDLTVVVPSQIAREIILQETVLIQQVRSSLHAPDLNLNILVDKSKFPDLEQNKPKKFLSPKEKYDSLVERNPKLLSFIHEFGLKIDTEY